MTRGCSGAGRLNQKVLPWPDSLSTPIFPPVRFHGHRAGFEQAAGLKTTKPRHNHVQQDYIRQFGGSQIDGFRPAFRLQHPIIFFAQEGGWDSPDGDVIVSY
jgi:hypothetical protein